MLRLFGLTLSVIMLSLCIGTERGNAGEADHEAVLELFTSQGCSSCPPADLVLKSYIGKKNIITLSYSIDYWDKLGWRDTFGSPLNSARQRAYAFSRKDTHIYTPQMVINGIAHADGARKYAIERELEKTNRLLNNQRMQLSVEKDNGQYVVQAGNGQNAVPVTLWLVRVQDVGIVEVKRGENYGRKLAYHNIVRSMKKIGAVKDKPIKLQLAGDDVPTKTGEHCVLLLQKGATGPILAAKEIWP